MWQLWDFPRLYMLCIVFLRGCLWLCECVCVCSDASNINGHMVAGEASLSQFLLGEEYRIESFFHCYNCWVAREREASKNNLKVSCAVNPFRSSHNGLEVVKNVYFYTGLTHYYLTNFSSLQLLIIQLRELLSWVLGSSLAQLSIITILKGYSLIPAYHSANTYP